MGNVVGGEGSWSLMVEMRLLTRTPGQGDVTEFAVGAVAGREVGVVEGGAFVLVDGGRVGPLQMPRRGGDVDVDDVAGVALHRQLADTRLDGELPVCQPNGLRRRRSSRFQRATSTAALASSWGLSRPWLGMMVQCRPAVLVP